MSRYPFILALLIALIASCFIVAPARAEPVTVTATADQMAYIGNPTTFRITVNGARNVDVPEFPQSDDYTVAYAGPSQSTQSFFDSRGGFTSTSSITHHFQITPRRTGMIIVPPINVSVDGRMYKTSEVRIAIVEPTELAGFALELQPEKTRFYVGEPVRLRLAWRLNAANFNQIRFTMPNLPGDLELAAHPDHPRQANRGYGKPPSYPIDLDGTQVVGVITPVAVAGETGNAMVIDQLLIAHAPGKLRLGSARVDFEVAMGAQFGRHCTVAMPVEIDVLPLPTEGQPADFSGLVGAYSVTASIDQREVSVGEPINLSVTISGPPPISMVPSLDFSAQQPLTKVFRVPRHPVLPVAANSSTARFQQMIRARNADVAAVPPIGINYFDSASGTYKVAQSQPIPIKVKPSADVGLGDDSDEADSTTTPIKPSAAVIAGPFQFNSARFDLRRAAAHPASMALIGIPPLMLATFALARAAARRRRRLEPVLRRRRAVRMAQRELDQLAAAAADAASAALGAGRALTNLAADWFGRPRHTLTSPEAYHLLATASSPAAAALAPVLAECDRVQFGEKREAQPGPSLIDQARAALRDAEAQLKGVA